MDEKECSSVPSSSESLISHLHYFPASFCRVHLWVLATLLQYNVPG